MAKAWQWHIWNNQRKIWRWWKTKFFSHFSFNPLVHLMVLQFSNLNSELTFYQFRISLVLVVYYLLTTFINKENFIMKQIRKIRDLRLRIQDWKFVKPRSEQPIQMKTYSKRLMFPVFLYLKFHKQSGILELINYICICLIAWIQQNNQNNPFVAQLWKQNSDKTLTNKSGRWSYHYKKWTIPAECVVGKIQDEEDQAQHIY